MSKVYLLAEQINQIKLHLVFASVEETIVELHKGQKDHLRINASLSSELIVNETIRVIERLRSRKRSIRRDRAESSPRRKLQNL